MVDLSLLEFYSVITGKDITWNEILKISEKVWHMTRLINAREIKDFGRKSDFPPARFYEEPVPGGPAEGYFITRDEINKLLDSYYAAREWDNNGIPLKETLERVGIINCH